jgi:hypothetical protein
MQHACWLVSTLCRPSSGNLPAGRPHAQDACHCCAVLLVTQIDVSTAAASLITSSMWLSAALFCPASSKRFVSLCSNMLPTLLSRKYMRWSSASFHFASFSPTASCCCANLLQQMWCSGPGGLHNLEDRPLACPCPSLAPNAERNVQQENAPPFAVIAALNCSSCRCTACMRSA